jgi:hypothetical protein
MNSHKTNMPLAGLNSLVKGHLDLFILEELKFTE